MRAGPLSSNAIVELLDQRFVSTWVFFHDLESLSESAATEGARSAAAQLRGAAIQPVDSLVLSPRGKLLGGLWVQDLFGWGGRPPGLTRPAPAYTGSPSARLEAFLEDMLDRLRG